jgi:putative ABC transport system permease protein
MPDWKPEIRARLASVRLAPAREAEIVEELSQHLEDRFRELVAAGATSDEAERKAREEFSAEDVLAPYLSALRQAHWADPAPPAASRVLSIQGIGADLHHSIRGLRTAPTFTVAALLVLALGIGATTAIFAVVDAVVLRGLPFDDADRIVAVGERIAIAKGRKGPFVMPGSAPPADPQALSAIEPQNYLDWIARQQVFESIAAIDAYGENTLLVPGAPPEAIVRSRVTAGFFDVLKVRAAIGRVFTAENEGDGRDRVAVLSDAFWRRRFGGDPNIVGHTIPINGDPYEVIGVMPARFTYPVGALQPAELWVPWVPTPNERVRGGRMRSIYLQSIARLKPGVSIDQARAQMNQVAASIEQANPQTNTGHTIGIRPLRDHLVGASTKSWMVMLLAAVGIVLLIACANVASLWLARAAARDRDIAVRAALGASRWRLVRLLLVESLLVSAIGTIVGIVLAWQAIRVLKAAMPEGVARVATIALDSRVLAVAAGLALVTGILSGIVPALQTSNPRLAGTLNENSRGGGAGRGRRRLRSALVVFEVALAVVLLVGAALFIGSFISVMRLDFGFQGDRVFTAQIFREIQPGQDPRSMDLGPAFEDIITRLQHTPGIVEASAAAPGIPLRVNMHIDGLTVPGKVLDGDTSVSLKSVSPGYHRALKIPLRRGRLFEATDQANSALVTILSEAAARVFFQNEDPVGRTVLVDGGRERTVVGVVGNARQGSIEINPHPEVYLPMTQSSNPSGYLVIRTSGNPDDVLPDVRAVVSAVLPHDPLRYIASMQELIARQTATRRLNMVMLSLFGALGLAISTIGVFGVLAHLVTQRTREIGVRMALGATRGQIIQMVLRNAMALVLAGIAVGGAAGWYLSTVAKQFLFGLDPHDARPFVLSAAALVLAAVLASYLPARRAASVDPTVALRSE